MLVYKVWSNSFGFSSSVFNYPTCFQLPHLFSNVRPVLNYPTCSQLSHLFSIISPVLNYPTCSQLPNLFSVAPPVLNSPTCSQLPRLFSLPPPVLNCLPVLNSPTCSQLPHLFSLPPPVLNSPYHPAVLVLQVFFFNRRGSHFSLRNTLCFVFVRINNWIFQLRQTLSAFVTVIKGHYQCLIMISTVQSCFKYYLRR